MVVGIFTSIKTFFVFFLFRTIRHNLLHIHGQLMIKPVWCSVLCFCFLRWLVSVDCFCRSSCLAWCCAGEMTGVVRQKRVQNLLKLFSKLVSSRETKKCSVFECDVKALSKSSNRVKCSEKAFPKQMITNG